MVMVMVLVLVLVTVCGPGETGETGVDRSYSK